MKFPRTSASNSGITNKTIETIGDRPRLTANYLVSPRFCEDGLRAILVIAGITVQYFQALETLIL